MKTLSRRTVLRGAGGVAIGLPLLSAMIGPRRARAAGAVAKRFIVFFSANGTIMNAWKPTGNETTFTLSNILSPLQSHIPDLLIMPGLNNEMSYTSPGGNPHDQGMGTLMTGVGMKIGPSGLGRAGHIIDGSSGGPSVDQVIAKAIGGSTKLSSLALGVNSTSTILEPMVTRLTYRDSYDPITPMDDPGKVFTTLFGDTTATQADMQALQKRRGTVLDAVLSNYMSLMTKVGADDRSKLDHHVTSIRELEKEISSLNTGQSCHGAVPMAPTVSLTPRACLQDGRPATCVGDFPAIGKAQMDLLALAMACDLTRVATLQWSIAESPVVHTQVMASGEHHLMSHDSTKAADLTRVNNWFAQQLSYLLDKLSATTDDGGTSVLDSSVVAWVNEQQDGLTHDRHNLPIVLAGKGNGNMRPGRFVTYNGQPHNQLLAAFVNMFGIPAPSFGDPRYAGVLTGLS
ncbi:MAG TPA: DUF1552 domain-containing protein [Polyangia bacterium]|jgi:hypothetical protein|nr:DUF1552 domain-containing protein [Polyangia bacterium]